MNLPEILDKEEKKLELSKLKEEYKIIRSVLIECKNNHLLYKGYNETFLSSLLDNYIYLRKNNKEKEMTLLLDKYNFNYITSIKYAINLMVNDYPSKYKKKAYYLPGIINIKEEKNLYIFDTILGRIYVYKANKILSSDIFNKKLKGMCYERTLEYLYEDNTYQAVLSYQANYFNKGHFHAYLKKDNTILDIANNALYYEYPNHFFDKTITTLSLDDINKEYDLLTKEYDYPKYYKLHTLTLYHTYKDNFKG